MSEVELNRPSTTRLEVYEPRPVLRAEHIPWVRFPVEQLFGDGAITD